MKYSRNIALLSIIGVLTAGCDHSGNTSLAGGSSVSMKVDMSLAKAMAGDTVIIESAKVLIKSIKFKSQADEDSLDFKVGPLVVVLDLMGGLTQIAAGTIPNGTYDKIKFKIHKAEHEETISDPDFNTGSGEDQRFSMIIKGTYNGVPFTYKCKKDIEQETTIDPPLVVSDSVPDVNATLLVTPLSWFKKNGNYLDPTDEGNRSDIDESIKKSFKKAYKDNDHDGKENDDDDKDGEDGDH